MSTADEARTTGTANARRAKAARLRGAFERVFGAGDFPARAVRVVRAPGRVNLIGEHTDYNEGFVLPAAIDRDIMIAAGARADRKVRAFSLEYGEGVEFELDRIEHDPVHAWSNYVRGTLWALLGRGLPVAGMDMAISGDVPRGAGLSSSAALETATAVAAQAIGGFALEGREMALACQEAENRFVGVRCGIMDQFASALGRTGNALMIDCRTYACEPVPVPPGYRIVICDSGVRRGLRDSEYNLRRAQCEQAVQVLRADLPRIQSLRDVSPDELEAFGARLPSEVRRRAKHVVSENARVLAGIRALAEGRVREFGRLMAESHASLRDLFEVSCPELDLLSELAGECPGVAGARMTGAGFGGCTVNLVREDAVAEFERTVMAEYSRRVDRSWLRAEPRVYVCLAAEGAGEVEADGAGEVEAESAGEVEAQSSGEAETQEAGEAEGEKCSG